MQLNNRIYLDISNLCEKFARYKKKTDNDITFLKWYFPGETTIIKKIYFKEKFHPFITISELSTIANEYSRVYTENENIWFDCWFNEFKILLERGNKIEQIRKRYNEKK